MSRSKKFCALMVCLLSFVMAGQAGYTQSGLPVSTCHALDLPITQQKAEAIATEAGAFFPLAGSPDFSSSVEVIATDSGCTWELISFEVTSDRKGWIRYRKHTVRIDGTTGRIMVQKSRRGKFFALRR